MAKRQENSKICFDIVRSGRPEIALLIGAGCSKTAGVPLAREIVEDIWRIESCTSRLEALPKGKKDSYPAVVGELSEGEYSGLFRRYMSHAKVNLAHLCIAELVKCEVVSRILTTNFDSLLIQACAIAGRFPAIFDCVATPDVKLALTDTLTGVYYLHGQAYGLRMVNTDSEIQRHSSVVQDVIAGSIQHRSLIVVGCNIGPGGMLDHLCQIKTAQHIIWVPYCRSDADEASKAFGRVGRRGRWVIGTWDADRFFYELLRALELEMPKIVHDVSGFVADFRNRIRLPGWFKKAHAGSGAGIEPAIAEPAPGVSVPTINLPKALPPAWTVETLGPRAGSE